MEFAFISRHQPTDRQVALAAEKGIRLTHVGDRDAFAMLPHVRELQEQGFVGVVVVHPLAALTAYRYGMHVGIFNGVNISPIGQPPKFGVVDFIVTTQPKYHCDTCAHCLGEYCKHG